MFFDNIGFGLNIKKMEKTVVKQKVERMLKLVGLEGFGSRDDASFRRATAAGGHRPGACE